MKTIKRVAKVGERILITSSTEGSYNVGDCFTPHAIIKSTGAVMIVLTRSNILVPLENYEVIEEDLKRDDEVSITSTNKEERIIFHISLLLDSHWIGKDGILIEIRKVIDRYKNS